MYIAGFDIGILNLAFCVIDTNQWKLYAKKESNDPGILVWENLNIMGEPEKCACKCKNGQICGKNASWVNDSTYYCGTHKPELCKKYKAPNTKTINIHALRKLAFQKLDEYDIFNQVNSIVIESQPRINQKMKMFAASIESYFILRQYIDNPNTVLRSIKASPAKNKLNVYTGPPVQCNHIKDPYDRRKYLAQQYTIYFLDRAPTVLEKYWYPNKKKDDLADAFLHVLLAI